MSTGVQSQAGRTPVAWRLVRGETKREAYRALVARLTDRAASGRGTDSKRLLPAGERLVLGICEGLVRWVDVGAVLERT